MIEQIRLHEGDCLVVLAGIAEDSVDAVVTDPPYELGFMGKSWDDSGIAFCPDTWRQVLRVMKPGAHLVAFGAPKNYHRLACAIEDAGFEIRDSLMWVFGTGFPKSANVSKQIDKAAGAEREVVGFRNPSGSAVAGNVERDHSGSHIWTGRLTSENGITDDAKNWQGWGTALKPAYEPIVLARKPLSEKTVAANVLRWGTGALNIDATRVETNPEVDDPRLGGKGSWKTDKAAKNVYEGGYAGKEIASSSLGRWPANLCHDGSQMVLDLFPYSKSTGGDGYRNSMFCGGKKTGGHGLGDEGSAARFFASFKQDYGQWLGQSLQQSPVSDVEHYSSLQSEAAASALSLAVEAPTPRLVLRNISCPEQNTSVSETQLKSVCEFVTTAMTTLEKRFLQGLPPERLSLSDSHASIVAIQEPTGIITITISLLKLNGFAEAATLRTIERSAEHGGGDLAAHKRFHYSAKASKTDRAGSKHPTVKPVSLMQWLVRMVTPPNGTVLDLFAGSGTTGQAAINEGFNAILIEREAEYINDIKNRLSLKIKEAV